MIKIFQRRALSLICFLLTIGIISSCDKNEVTNSGAVELLSFGPTGAMHGDTLHIIGNNLHKVTAVELTGASVPQSAFIEQTSEKILIKIPTETQKGFITLVTPQGNLTSLTQLDLEVPVVVTSITGSARPGENITIKGNFLNWVTRVVFEKDKAVDSFVSKSLTEIVVKVPKDAQTGKLLLLTGGTEPLEIETDSTLKVTLPGFTSFTPNPVEREKNLTITGTNLDLVKGVLFKGKTVADTIFVSQSATEIVVKVPKEANRGKIDLVAFSGLKVASSVDLTLIGDLPPLDPFPLPMYTDGFQSGFQDWSWAARDINNTENVRQGTKAIKATYAGNGYEGITFHNDNGPAAGTYTTLEFSIFAPAALDGKKLNVVTNGGWSTAYQVTLVGGEWRTYQLTMANLGNPNPLKEIVLQAANWSGVLYIDHVGLR